MMPSNLGYRLALYLRSEAVDRAADTLLAARTSDASPENRARNVDLVRQADGLRKLAGYLRSQIEGAK